MKSILAALDLEAGNDAVLARAVQLASAHGACLVLLHVVDPEPFSHGVDVSGRSETDLQDQLRQQALPAPVRAGSATRRDATGRDRKIPCGESCQSARQALRIRA
ncbi:universal stress protein [Faunimonas sp. B44]|uniref:universal stress protein n=1 Tax=Faunimonas sp. B44 TaxID=3461493 RepID=UPI004043BEE0